MIHFSPAFIAIAAAALSLAQAAPTRNSTVGSGLCSGNYTKSEIPLWSGAPERVDAAVLSWDKADNTEFCNELSAVTNSIMELKRLVDKNTGEDHWDYIPRIIFGAPADYTNLDSHQNGADAAKKSSPMVRVNDAHTTAHVNLNLFPLSKEPLTLCVEFPINKVLVAPLSGSKQPGVWLRALNAAFRHDDVKARLKKNPLFAVDLKPKTPLASVAFMEMMTGLPAKYVWRQRANTTFAESTDAETQTKLDDVGKLKDWLFKDGAKANWNPTIMFSPDGGLRVVRPFDDLTGVILQNSLSKGPDYLVDPKGEGRHDLAVLSTQALWDTHFMWAVQLKSNSFNPVDTVTAARNTKDGEFTAYFTEA